jgi:hypothetical protein
MGPAPQSLLLPVRCPVCGRPGRELLPCPWCGERAPAAPRTRGDLVRLVAGLALLAAGTATKANLAGTTAATLAGLLSGFLLAPSGPARGASPAIPCAALAASILALALRAFGVPFPLPAVSRLSWLLPALAAGLLALRVPAEAPNAPASGAPRRRAWRRHAPELAAALSLAPFAAAFAARETTLPGLVGLAAVLGAWISRLSSPAVPLLLSSGAFALLLPEPAALAFGLLAAALRRPAP